MMHSTLVKTRFALSLCLLTVLLASCSAPAVSTPTTTPTITPEPASPPFIILAYATDGIFADIIPYEQLTHINYSFLTPKDDGTFNVLNNAWKLKQIVKTAHEHNVKVNIAVGGWGWDRQFETVAADPSLRSVFVQNLKTFVDEYQLDGADIDWEYPDPGQSSQNFLALIRELRAAMPDKLLTTAVIAYGDETGLGIPAESFELFDFVNVMTYEGSEHGTMEQFNEGLEYWSGRGLAKEKLVIGAPFYSDGGVSFAKLVKDNPAAAQTDTTEYIGVQQFYNGIPTIQTKTQIAMEKAGGIMFWVLDHDAQGEYSLVNAIYQTVHTP
jgi:GH18 family chitinase